MILRSEAEQRSKFAAKLERTRTVLDCCRKARLQVRRKLEGRGLMLTSEVEQRLKLAVKLEVVRTVQTVVEELRCKFVEA